MVPIMSGCVSLTIMKSRFEILIKADSIESDVLFTTKCVISIGRLIYIIYTYYILSVCMYTVTAWFKWQPAAAHLP